MAGADTAGAGRGVAAIASTEGDQAGRSADSGPPATARWTPRPGTTGHDGDPGDELGPTESQPAAVAAEGVTGEGISTDAIGGQSDTSGATSSGSAST